jgi:hypothetical protein
LMIVLLHFEWRRERKREKNTLSTNHVSVALRRDLQFNETSHRSSPLVTDDLLLIIRSRIFPFIPIILPSNFDYRKGSKLCVCGIWRNWRCRCRSGEHGQLRVTR